MSEASLDRKRDTSRCPPHAAVAEIGGKRRKLLLDVMPVQQSPDGEAMPEVVHDRRCAHPHPCRCRLQGPQRPKQHKLKVHTQGQKRGVTAAIRRQLKRRAAIEPVIGHCKGDHRIGRNFLAHAQGDAINTFRRLIAWLGLILRMPLQTFMPEPALQKA